GDFVLQPDAWVEHKEKHKHKSLYLYLHILVHLACLLVILSFNQKYWAGILIIIASHYVIDLAKLHLQNKFKQGGLFLADQLAHIGVLLFVLNMYQPFEISLKSLYSTPVLLFLMAILFVTFVTAILIKNILGNWKFIEQSKNESLKNAGKYIGMLERLFVFGFVILQQYQAIGFLIAAKSIFRFSDLSRAKDRKLTEYILVGTLLSVIFAILTAFMYQYARQIIKN
ncbi:MAG: DUF3307 domain-containing protein, partial [Ginsengibacter sp.]